MDKIISMLTSVDATTWITVVTIVAIVGVIVFIRSLAKSDINIETPTPSPTVTPTVTPLPPGVERLNIHLVDVEPNALSITVDEAGGVTTAPFNNGNLSSTVVELKEILSSQEEYYYIINNVSYNNISNFSTPRIEERVELKNNATFKVMRRPSSRGDTWLQATMVVYNHITDAPVVAVSIRLNLIDSSLS